MRLLGTLGTVAGIFCSYKSPWTEAISPETSKSRRRRFGIVVPWYSRAGGVAPLTAEAKGESARKISKGDGISRGRRSQHRALIKQRYFIFNSRNDR